jgi:hypothetical protein
MARMLARFLRVRSRYRGSRYPGAPTATRSYPACRSRTRCLKDEPVLLRRVLRIAPEAASFVDGQVVVGSVHAGMKSNVNQAPAPGQPGRAVSPYLLTGIACIPGVRSGAA